MLLAIIIASVWFALCVLAHVVIAKRIGYSKQMARNVSYLMQR